MNEFKPLEIRHLDYIDVVNPEPDYKALYHSQVYVTKKLAKMLYDAVEVHRTTLKDDAKATAALNETQANMLAIIKS